MNFAINAVCLIQVPTAAANIGFAIGRFQSHADLDMPEIVSYSPPGLLPLVRHTCDVNLPRAMGFYEEVLSCRFPYGTYRQVFVDAAPDELTTYASMALISVNCLYHKRVLDLVLPTRQTLAFGLAQQFFGCFVGPTEAVNGQWVPRALARYVNGMYVERFFGTSEQLFQLHR